MTEIAAITIGQSPRDDIIPDLKKLIEIDISIEVRGILDNLDMEGIKMLAPTKKEAVLKSRLRNGNTVSLGYNSVVKGIRKSLSKLRSEGFEIIALLCTCHFSELENEKALIHTACLLEEKVEEMVKKGSLGVLIPSPEQISQTKKKWERPGVKVKIASASPYMESEEILSASADLDRHGVDLIVLDCIGYNLSIFKKLKEISSTPMLLPLEILASHLKKQCFSLLY